MCVQTTRAAVVSNPVLLEGLLRNLVRNAVTYTEPGGRILIGCRRAQQDLRIDVYRPSTCRGSLTRFKGWIQRERTVSASVCSW
jgi:signal transduction histidine kinase